MDHRRAGNGRIKATTAMAAAAWGLMLAACHSQPPTQPQLTGHHGGLLPGMVLPPPATPPKSNTPAGYTGLQDQVLPDGHVLRSELFQGVVVSQTWYSSLRLPEKMVVYENGDSPKEMYEYGSDGKPVRHTVLYSGTRQPLRIEVLAGGGARVQYFITFWPNGNYHIVSEADAPGADGPVNRVREWYANGNQKLLKQTILIHDHEGQVAGELLQDHQMEWDETGHLVNDQVFDHGRMLHDYLAEAKFPEKILKP